MHSEQLLQCLFLLFCLSTISVAAPDLAFQVSSGGNDNYFLRDNVTSAQLVLAGSDKTLSSVRRLVFASPGGNTGALAYFLPLTNQNDAGSTPSNSSALPLTIALVNGSFTSTTDDFQNAGAQADLVFSGNATLGVAIIGAVRAMRDYVEGSGTMHEIFNYTLESYNSTFVHLHRRYINTTSPNSNVFKGASLQFSPPEGSDVRFLVTPSNGSSAQPTINIVVPSGTSANQSTVRFRFLTNDTALVGLNTEGLFLDETQGSSLGIKTALKGLADGMNSAAQQASFLTYTDKFIAGGWRFLTYFGRDSLIALRLLMPTLTPEAIESALGAVIERANSTGALCHEETVGDYASFININNNRSDLGNAPFYDYKMIDTDLLLLPSISHYFLELPQGKNRARAFLQKQASLQNGTYGDILNRIANYNLQRAIPFSQKQTFSNLLAFRPGEPVGNWRDSNEGTGYGPIPFDVNSALVPASLRATQSLIEAGIFKASNNGADAGKVANVWETKAVGLFEVRVGREVAEERLVDFVGQVGLDSSLLEGGTPKADVSFYALSLREDGSPVEVMNSDLGFNLMYGINVSKTFLQRTIDALTPYPRGLLTNVGMVVTNPAYDTNRTNVRLLDRTAYHGTVIWSFQQGLMAGGIARQLGFCFPNSSITADVNPAPPMKPTWCADKSFVQSLRDAQGRLWAAINGAKDNIFSEVWSYSFNHTTEQFDVADLASLSPTGTESDAIQLWSYGFLGLLDPSGAATSS